jgi:hypothetical protein
MGEVYGQQLSTDWKAQIWETMKQEASRLSATEKAQLAADVIGIFDPTPVSAVASAGLALWNLDGWGVALSVVGAVPYLGSAADIARVAKVAPKAAKALTALVKYGDDIGKAGKEVLEKYFSLSQVIAARRKAAQAVQQRMKKKRMDPKCKDCGGVPSIRMPTKKGKWNTPDGKPPRNGTGKFTFDNPITLPNGKQVTSIDYKDGFPNFDPFVSGGAAGKKDLWHVTGDVGKDATALKNEYGIRSPGPDWTLHHFENGQVGYVPSAIHNVAEGGMAHAGGNSIVNSKHY